MRIPGLLLMLALMAGQAAAELPLDERGTLAPAKVRHRVLVGDVAINHIVDGRIHFVDADSGRYLGLVSAGFAGQFTLSADGRELYVATTYMTRLHRGERVDVVEVHDVESMSFKYEIPIEPRRAQAVGYKGYLRTSSDGRLLYVLNATPAVSVSVVDLQQRRQVAEIDAAGCWGLYPAARHARRFSMLCGDGSIATYTLDEAGRLPAQGGRENTGKVFDPQADALFISAAQMGDTYWFASFAGHLVAFDLGQARASKGQSLALPAMAGVVNGKSARAQGWRPGGYGPLALDAQRGRLFVAMHPGGKEGSHKMPAAQIWVIDIASGKRIAVLPGQSAIALHVPRNEDQPMLVAIDGMKNGLVVMSGPRYRVSQSVVPIGSASVSLDSH